jgi:hypothetical protein
MRNKIIVFGGTVDVAQFIVTELTENRYVKQVVMITD